MVRQFFVLIVSLGFLWIPVVQAEIDASPLAVEVVPAFTKLQWPDWLTGLDEGKPRDPRPIIVTGAGDDSGRMFVATQYGTIHFFENNPEATELHTFLDIRDRVMEFKPQEAEEGFLGLAFHPKFKENGEFFVYYTPQPTADKPHVARISRFRVKKDNPLEGDPASEEILLDIDQPYWNHNGGTVVFGSDGYLYLGVGDGGAWNDPHMNGQNLQTLLGKILRIDVDHKGEPNRDGKSAPYAIPKDNPFASDARYARGEIWAYGIRNPWRISFDRETSTCWGADVGQDQWEEIDIIEKGGNYGWNLREGQHKFGPGGVEATERVIDPIWEYHHDVGKSITGGYVYRGQQIPELQGGYLYADFVTGQVWALWYDEEKKAVIANRSIRDKGPVVITFGEDDDGEVYFTSEREIFGFAAKP
ncbi:MAG: PQQ-dependent sugar dehydrogenase [Bythopirellula sp.]|nr:PQQ-dependent sugar dehydrogenase [Bythopirellula sp.]